jgi:rhodanese-related sulfurtransferase
MDEIVDTSKMENITFTATIELLYCGGMRVKTDDCEKFVQADVSYHESFVMNFTPEVGQTVKMTILPDIGETYPVRVIALDIVPIGEKPDQAKATYQKITAKEAKDLIDSGEELVILDVRTEAEYKEGHLKNAVLLPDTEVEARAKEVLPDPQKTVLVYCRTGRRSAIAAKMLVEMGYQKVLDMGGISSWPYEIEK